MVYSVADHRKNIGIGLISTTTITVLLIWFPLAPIIGGAAGGAIIRNYKYSLISAMISSLICALIVWIGAIVVFNFSLSGFSFELITIFIYIFFSAEIGAVIGTWVGKYIS